jgi:hypothetical protein
MKRLIPPLLMMVCSVSWAKWELTGSNSYETVFFYHDRSTIQRNGSFVMMWSMVNFSSVTSDDWGNRYRSIKSRNAYNCLSQEYTTTSIVKTDGSMGGGDVVDSTTLKERDWKWAPISPNSVSEHLLQIACGIR